MASQDAEELMNLFHNVSQTMETFTDKQLVFMNDTSQTTSQQLVFDNISLMSRASIWATSFIRVPVMYQASRPSPYAGLITSNTVTPFNMEPYHPGVTPIALKCGGPSLFYGIQLNLSTGTGIINDQNSQFLRPMLQCKLELNEEGCRFYGNESGFQPDYFPEISTFIGPTTFLGAKPLPVGGGHLAPGNTLLGSTVNGIPTGTDYSLVQSGLFNQPYEFIQNAAVQVSMATLPATATHVFTNGLLVSSPCSQFLGASFTLLGGTAVNIFSVVVNSENFSFSSNALVAFSQPMILQFTTGLTGLSITAATITSPGSGYGTDGTSPLGNTTAGSTATLLPNLFQMTMKQNALVTALTAGGGAIAGQFYAMGTINVPSLLSFVVQMQYSLPGLAPYGVESEFKGGYVSTQCRNPFYNAGFKERIRSWWNNTDVVGIPTATSNTIYRSNVIVRLRDLHDVFRQMDFPTENTRFQLFLSLAAPFNLGVAQQFFGLQYGYEALLNPPIVAIGTSPSISGGVLQNGVQQSACTMYFNAVSFHADTAVRLSNALSNPNGGLVKQLTFIETEMQQVAFNIGSVNSITSGSALISAQIQTTSTRVKRIHFFGIPVGSPAAWSTAIGQAIPAAATGLSSQTQSLAQPFAGFIGSVKFQGIQLRINGLPWRQNPLSQDIEFWSKEREMLPGYGEDDNVGSKWDYAQFQLGFASVYSFDLTRQGVRPSINDPILIGVDITRVSDLANGGFGTQFSPCDIWCLIEKESNVQLNIGTASAAATKQY